MLVPFTLYWILPDGSIANLFPAGRVDVEAVFGPFRAAHQSHLGLYPVVVAHGGLKRHLLRSEADLQSVEGIEGMERCFGMILLLETPVARKIQPTTQLQCTPSGVLRLHLLSLDLLQ